MRERLALLLLAVLLITPCLGEGHSPDLKDMIIKIHGDVAFAGDGSKSGDMVRIGESVEVAEGDTVEGDVVSVGGSVTVRGCVTGDAVAVGGDLILEAPGCIGGDAVAVGGEIDQGEGTSIGGETVEVGFGPFKFIQPFIGAKYGPRACALLAASPLRKVIGVIVLLIIVLLIALFLPGPTRRLSRTVGSFLPRSILFGILGEVAIVPLCVILAVSVVGIPLIPAALIAIGAAFLFGMVGVGFVAGDLFLRRAGATAGSAVAAVAIGIILIELLSLLGAFLSPVVPGLGGALNVAGAVVLYFAWTVGFGAVILTRFGTRAWSPRRVEAPAEVLAEKGDEIEAQ